MQIHAYCRFLRKRKAFTKIPPHVGRIMRLTAFILLAGCLTASAKGFSQKITLKEKDASLQQVFREIEKQTGYQFFFADSDVKLAKKVTLDAKDAEFIEVLNLCFKDQPLTFSISGKTVMVRLKDEPKKEPSIPIEAANPPPNEIHGKVADTSGAPIQGASVIIKGTKRGTETDADGVFTLKDVPDNAIIIISFVGYETQSYKSNGKTSIVVSLKRSTESLQDVFVNKGYYSEKQRLTTGDVTVVKADVISEQPVSDPILALEGRVPGLYIEQTSGMPGANMSVYLRGQNFITSDAISSMTQNDPLYIVDGVPFNSASPSLQINGGIGSAFGSPVLPTTARGQGISPFNNLNPSDIESITVLKDADATSIYGSRGANGVILITTKKGSAGKTKFDLNMNTGSSRPTRFLPLLNTQQYLEMRHEAFFNDGYTPQSYDADVNGDWDTTRYTNWQNVLIQNPATFTSVQASLSGGTTNTQFFVGGGYNRQQIGFPGDYGDVKGSVHMNIVSVSTDQRFHLSATASYVHDNNHVPGSDFTENISSPPNTPPIYDKNGNLNWQVVNGAATFTNPYAGTNTSASTYGNNLIGALNLSYLIAPGLNVRTNIGYNTLESQQLQLIYGTSVAPPYNTSPNVRRNGTSTSNSEGWLIEPQLNYNRRISKGMLDVLVGVTFQETLSNSTFLFAKGFASDALVKNPLAASSFSYGYSQGEYRYNAIFARLGYNWNEKYVLNMTARRDGSSRFGPGRQFGNFGSIGAGWIFSKEKCIKNLIPSLSFGKLRGSYGTVGSDAIGDYQFETTYSFGGSNYNGVNQLAPNGVANPYFQWQVVKKLEAGIELGFLKDHILLSTSYYFNRTGNQLTSYPLPAVTGSTSVVFNLPATLENYGLEFSLNTINLRTKGFTWTSAVNLSIPQNKVAAFPGIQQTPFASEYLIGHSIFSTYVFHYLGIDPQSGIYSFATKQSTTQGPSSNGLIDYVLSKPITQKYFGGFMNSFSYKRLKLDFFIQFVKQLGRNYQAYLAEPPGFELNQPTWVLNRWRKPGDQAQNEQFTEGGGTGLAYTAFQTFQGSDGVLTDASFIRFKNLALSYQFRENWLSKAHMQNLRIFVQCQNLFTISKYQGLDPETGGALALPPLRTLTLGLQADL